ncbi:hypothetical protein Pcinc_033643 [Petrolisthes cinctipes]|uniref:Uncharacterized protein n=1 Tax=Petrolisthes cinctipes TaxID=88211 RepID=A0AAE1ES09_PETCI|nr:hypothetical protein Pcinc_033643 [Petrolisthes cinctipes]
MGVNGELEKGSLASVLSCSATFLRSSPLLCDMFHPTCTSHSQGQCVYQPGGHIHQQGHGIVPPRLYIWCQDFDSSHLHHQHPPTHIIPLCLSSYHLYHHHHNPASTLASAPIPYKCCNVEYEASVVLAPCGPYELDQTEELQPSVLFIMTLGRVGVDVRGYREGVCVFEMARWHPHNHALLPHTASNTTSPTSHCFQHNLSHHTLLLTQPLPPHTASNTTSPTSLCFQHNLSHLTLLPTQPLPPHTASNTTSPTSHCFQHNLSHLTLLPTQPLPPHTASNTTSPTSHCFQHNLSQITSTNHKY